MEHKEHIERGVATGESVNSFASSELLRWAEEILTKLMFRKAFGTHPATSCDPPDTGG